MKAEDSDNPVGDIGGLGRIPTYCYVLPIPKRPFDTLFNYLTLPIISETYS
jgi:hypothetical protein